MNKIILKKAWQRIAEQQNKHQVWAYPMGTELPAHLPRNVYLVERHPRSAPLFVIGNCATTTPPPDQNGVAAFSVGVHKKSLTTQGQLTRVGEEYCQEHGMHLRDNIKWMLSADNSHTHRIAEQCNQRINGAPLKQERRAELQM